MGQQQLLLLVLGIVIVGIAIVVGINAYSENSVKTNWDALLQDGLRIASDAQAWKGKPELFGGSPDDTKADTNDFLGVSFPDLGYPPAATGILCYDNLNGQYSVLGTNGSLTITGQNQPYNNRVILTVTGITEETVEISQTAGDICKGGLNEAGGDCTIAPLSCT